MGHVPARSFLREKLEELDDALFTTAKALWQRSSSLHERQNWPDSNENGLVHVRMVENYIWRLLDETLDSKTGKKKIDELTPHELFILSCAACCHDFDKGLNSANPLPEGFRSHGKGSGEFVVTNAKILGLNEHEAEEIRSAIAIHDIDGDEFRTELEKLSQRESTPLGPFNLQRAALLLKTADILHCDYSRIADIGIDPEKLTGKDKTKYLARKSTKGWKINGSRILLQASLSSSNEKREAFGQAFDYMQTKEWRGVSANLMTCGFPHELELDTNTKVQLEGLIEPATSKAQTARPSQKKTRSNKNSKEEDHGDSKSHKATETEISLPEKNIFELCPRCLARTRQLVEDPELRKFLQMDERDDFIDRLKAEGALQVLREISDKLKSPGPKLGVSKIKELLACLAPLHVSADFVSKARLALKIDLGRHIYAGGVLAVSRNIDDGADAILRSALFDELCSWNEESLRGASWPQGRHQLNACDVPSPGTTDQDRAATLKKRVLEECNAKDLQTAMESMAEWLYDGVPLMVICDDDVIRLLEKIPDTIKNGNSGETRVVKHLALFYSKCKETHAGMRSVIERLSTILEYLARS